MFLSKAKWCFAIASFGIFVLVTAFFTVRVDWALFQSAVPPIENVAAGAQDVTVKVLSLNAEDPLKDRLSLNAGGKVAVHLIAETDTSKWRWNIFSNTPAAKRARKKQEVLPAARVQIEFVRRSSLPPGEIVQSSSMSNPGRINASQIEWKRTCRVPSAPGVYRVRLLIGKQFFSGVPTPEEDQIVYERLSSFDVRVNR